MLTLSESDKGYSSSFVNILNSIAYSDTPISDESEAVTEKEAEDSYFDGTKLGKCPPGN